MSVRGNVIIASVSVALVAFGCNPATKECAPASLDPLQTEATYAVVYSDYIASAIGLMDAEGELITEAWIDSGTTRPNVSATLSGDVVLPSHAEPGALTYLDRFGVDVLTRIAMPDGKVLSQTHAQLPAEQSAAAFRSNPRDRVALAGGQMLVSRYEPNGYPASPELDRGDDLVLLDAARDTITARVDLALLRTQVGGDTIYARPDRMVYLEDVLVFGAARLSRNFRVAGPGAIGVLPATGGRVDPAAQVAVLELPQMSNCGEVISLDVLARRVAVLCSGVTFRNNIDRRAAAGIAVVEWADSGSNSARVATLWRSSEHPDSAVPRQGLVALDADHVFVVASGDAETQAGDFGMVITLSTGASQVVMRSTNSFVLGEGAWSPDKQLLLVPDADAGVRRIRRNAGAGDEATFEELEPVRTPCRNLPPRQIRQLSQQP